MSQAKQPQVRAAATRKRKSSTGFTLLEVILALAILAGSLAALGEVMRLADQTASLTEGESQAQIYAASIMDELLSGARQLENVSQATLNEDDSVPWVYSIETNSTNLDQLVSVRVSVEQKLDARLQPARFDLTRFMPNPDYTPPDASSQSNSSTSSTTSSTSSTTASGGTQK
ncbi:MAG TPA: prepilin-type N-terminal cleavage/methylation domain-containing protein [Lacipirellulaceae bacterium]|jgi:prepilin-type N-terminal cleavage/methylation domain-containing protein|nr:prepilin-type N-terminal cleavage/methylation domain-containing protein [Lacipirellulaceae bacterium]